MILKQFKSIKAYTEYYRQNPIGNDYVAYNKNTGGVGIFSRIGGEEADRKEMLREGYPDCPPGWDKIPSERNFLFNLPSEREFLENLWGKSY
jgi:hypothetical protein